MRGRRSAEKFAAEGSRGIPGVVRHPRTSGRLVRISTRRASAPEHRTDPASHQIQASSFISPCTGCKKLTEKPPESEETCKFTSRERMPKFSSRQAFIFGRKRLSLPLYSCKTLAKASRTCAANSSLFREKFSNSCDSILYLLPYSFIQIHKAEIKIHVSHGFGRYEHP